LIHGDIKYSNILVSGGEISLIDWEPVLVYADGGGTFLRSTAPYIATQDIAANTLTEATDRIAYYFLCKRLLNGWWPLTRQDVVSVESQLVNSKCREILDISTVSVAGRQ
jgi:serine/threonine protein kinase